MVGPGFFMGRSRGGKTASLKTASLKDRFAERPLRWWTASLKDRFAARPLRCKKKEGERKTIEQSNNRIIQQSNV